jgi:molybdopterin converting factor small subunit
VGKDEIMIKVCEKGDVASLLEELKQKYPELGSFIEPMVISVNREYAVLTTLLGEGDEVALIPPVSGG